MNSDFNVKEHEVISYEKIKYINIFINDVNYRTPHIHGDFEICIVLKGEIVYKISGIEYNCKESDIVICNPLEIHEMFSENNAVLLCIQFSPEYLKELGYENVLFDINYISADERVKYKRTYEAIYRLSKSYFADEDKDIKLICCGWLNILIHYLLQNSSSKGQEKKKIIDDNRHVINSIVDYLNEHYSEKVSLIEVADMVHLNHQYLSRLFKKYTGVNFQDFLTTIRLYQALYLINETDESLTDICFECGFSDYKYLNSKFQKQYGCSPKEYRKKHPRKISKGNTNSKENVYTRDECVELIKKRLKT